MRSMNDPTRPSQTGSPPATLEGARAAADAELQELLRSVLLGGRYALFIAELATILLRGPRLTSLGFHVEAAVLLLLFYNAGVLVALNRLPPRKVRAHLFLVADALAIAVLVGLTGGLSSPFASLFFLVTLLAAIYYDLRGGLLAAAGGVLLTVGTAPLGGAFWHALSGGEIRTQIVPYLLLHGAVAGYLVQRLKQLHERRIQFDAGLRALQHEERLRQHEAEIAREIQTAALTRPPEHPCYEVATCYRPAREVGGDLYACVTEGERLALVVADVSGKGIPAALVSTTLCHLVRCLRPLEDPAGFLAAVNEDLVELLPEETFATLVLATLDPGRQEIAIYNAGHPPPLILREGAVEAVEGAGPPLGILPGLAFEAIICPFRGGDTLLLYSDGLIEARDTRGEMLNVEGLALLARGREGQPSSLWVPALADEVSAFGEVGDDLTLLGVRARP
jgi:serine phosphatase RsbU (regulator of sigma subunit)